MSRDLNRCNEQIKHASRWLFPSLLYTPSICFKAHKSSLFRQQTHVLTAYITSSKLYVLDGLDRRSHLQTMEEHKEAFPFALLNQFLYGDPHLYCQLSTSILFISPPSLRTTFLCPKHRPNPKVQKASPDLWANAYIN